MILNVPYAVQRLSKEEGRISKVYRDSLGIETIGVGRNLRDVGLYPDEIDYLLMNDIRRVQADVDREFPWVSELDEARQFVIFDMAFNMGINKLKGFVNTLRCLKARDYEGCAKGMEQSLWYSQVGKRAKALTSTMRSGIL